MLAGTLPLIPQMERRKHGGGIGPARAEHEVLPYEGIGAVDGGDRQKILFQLADHRIGAFFRRAVGQLHDANKVALVFFRQETAWNDGEETPNTAIDSTACLSTLPTVSV